MRSVFYRGSQLTGWSCLISDKLPVAMLCDFIPSMFSPLRSYVVGLTCVVGVSRVPVTGTAEALQLISTATKNRSGITQGYYF